MEVHVCQQRAPTTLHVSVQASTKEYTAMVGYDLNLLENLMVYITHKARHGA